MTDTAGPTHSEAQPSMLATVEQDWNLLESLPPLLHAEDLNHDALTEAYEALDARHKDAQLARDYARMSQLEWWLGSLRLDQACNLDTPPFWAEEYFEDSMTYLYRTQEMEGIPVQLRNKATLLEASVDLERLYIVGEEPTAAVVKQYKERLANVAVNLERDKSRTRVQRMDELIDTAIPLVLSRREELACIANARERGDIPTPHPDLASHGHQHHVMIDGHKIAIKTSLWGHNGRACSIPGKLSYICLQSLARHHMQEHNSAVVTELEQRQQTGNISYYALWWAVQHALGKPVQPEELKTVDALAEDILDRVQEVADTRPEED